MILAQTILALAFGVLLGAGGVLGWLVLGVRRDDQRAAKAHQDLADMLREVTKGNGEVIIKKLKRKPKSEVNNHEEG
jgi:predicted negative regulator of RcsB-dependent stress response